jgi:hypothetical protein
LQLHIYNKRRSQWCSQLTSKNSTNCYISTSYIFLTYVRNKRMFEVIVDYTGWFWKLCRYFNHELLASCRTRKKCLKNSMSKNKMTFIFWATGFLVLKHISYRLLRIGVHFIKHDIQGCIFKMCRTFTYEVVGQRRKLIKAIKKNCSSKNKWHFIFWHRIF